MLPASITNRFPHGSATTVASTLAAHVASVAVPRRICWTSLKTYVPGRISLTPAAAATIRPVGVDPTLISRIGTPARSHRSAVSTSSPASRPAIASTSATEPARYAWPAWVSSPTTSTPRTREISTTSSTDGWPGGRPIRWCPVSTSTSTSRGGHVGNANGAPSEYGLLRRCPRVARAPRLAGRTRALSLMICCGSRQAISRI